MKPQCLFYSRIALHFVLAVLAGFSFRASSLRASESPAVGRAPKIAAAPKGVTDLKFSDFFVTPMGPKGLEFTSTLRELNGRRVRILGYVVRQENSMPGTFLMTALPLQVHDEHYGLADDLPAATLFVSAPSRRKSKSQPSAGLVLVTGKLEIGNREEADGRISAVRLTMESISAQPSPVRSRLKGSAVDLLKRSAKF
jgi:hypothetical protein